MATCNKASRLQELYAMSDTLQRHALVVLHVPCASYFLILFLAVSMIRCHLATIHRPHFVEDLLPFGSSRILTLHSSSVLVGHQVIGICTSAISGPESAPVCADGGWRTYICSCWSQMNCSVGLGFLHCASKSRIQEGPGQPTAELLMCLGFIN
ncbi:hypothetical protein K437DRAFT_16133 [Tilletiaria anomala UBC 951]|uniref:Uncharacterized protein n=1 Tax=Tilletiaria anomala (strain ATCC 24038 / CBS 436.72 / UBC 951) TaxID=1037660 RepID=A0A066WIJ5_TILAU|nr:uncharacterized protein K437DRAFT_16133 [Tilletiaria anomala UBC 951]KDN52328.1 hypothetical protein K437DRAFT_16133 [Tilletiaria anomala UBC 951]